MAKNLYFSDGGENNLIPDKLNGTRLGFASSTSQELEQSVEILKNLLKIK